MTTRKAPPPTSEASPEGVVRTRWFRSGSVGVKVFADELITKQEFKDECDVVRIMRRYNEGAMPALSSRQPVYADVASVPDFLEAQQLVRDAQAHFNELPAEVRDRFGHDPVQLLAFLHDPANDAEARRLGLVNPLPESPPPKVEGEK